ncbi:MAG TPA: F0F1 ATP synthase subunit gamma [Dehalococcoidia bacterium]|nr:F0F1 ATP synthase subunit gamma [Dehalococcoidia bacterium]
MASSREIRRRIRSVRNIAQITRAMEMVAASKMRRAEQRVVATRPYSEKIASVIASLSGAAHAGEETSFPLLDQRPVQRAAMVLITPDRGLCGALNSNIIRRASRYILDEAGVPVSVIAVGKKGRDFMVRHGTEVVAEFTALGDYPTLDQVAAIAQVAVDDFVAGRVDTVQLVYTRFINTLSQRPELQQLLPVDPPTEGGAPVGDFIFEPSPEGVLNSLLPRYVDQQVYRAILENVASFYSAQMVAMRNATDNARDLVSDLTLEMNKARQAQITRELSEISAGANALRG